MEMPGRPEAPQHLVIDGDDTLWENNVHFEAAIDEFIDFLSHSTLDRAQVRAALDAVERLNIAVHGYGARAFALNLAEAYRTLAEKEVGEAQIVQVLALGERVLSHPMELLPDVEETLERLGEQGHELTLFTKGSADEQLLKVENSGLARHFKRVIVPPEKDVDAYRRLVADHGFDPEATWMVGNSPRSDINPALAAGLGAVFIPHSKTWSLELAEVTPSPRLVVLQKFAEMVELFPARGGNTPI